MSSEENVASITTSQEKNVCFLLRGEILCQAGCGSIPKRVEEADGTKHVVSKHPAVEENDYVELLKGGMPPEMRTFSRTR